MVMRHRFLDLALNYLFVLVMAVGVTYTTSTNCVMWKLGAKLVPKRIQSKLEIPPNLGMAPPAMHIRLKSVGSYSSQLVWVLFLLASAKQMFLLLTCAQTAIGDLRTSLSLVGRWHRQVLLFKSVSRRTANTTSIMHDACQTHFYLSGYVWVLGWGGGHRPTLETKILGINGNLFLHQILLDLSIATCFFLVLHIMYLKYAIP